MKRECAICHKEFDEHDMETVNTGRVQWLCWECYRHGHGQVTGFEIRCKERHIKEAQKRK